MVTVFGNKKRFIQEANRRSILKGTVGSFGKWCRSQGLDKDGKVTMRCIKKAKKLGNTKLIKRATYAQNIGGYAGAVHRRSKFGKKNIKKYKKYKKYTKSGGRKSPGVSATKFPVGTIKKGLDGKNWVIKVASNGVQRWSRVSSFGKKRSFRFGSDADDYINEIIDQKLEKGIEKEIVIAEQIIAKYPKNDSIKRRCIRLLNKAKKMFYKHVTIDNLMNTITILTTLLVALSSLNESYSTLESNSSIFSAIVSPINKLFKRLFKIHASNAMITNNFNPYQNLRNSFSNSFPNSFSDSFPDYDESRPSGRPFVVFPF